MGIFDFLKSKPEQPLPKQEVRVQPPIPKQTAPAVPKQIAPTPSSNVGEILALSEIIQRSRDVETLRQLYKQKGDYNHPQICYYFGTAFLIKGDKFNAKHALIKGATYGIQYPCAVYGHAFVDSIGQCLSHLMTQFSIEDRDNALKATALSYIYLSRCIELYPGKAADSYRTRALLFKDHNGYNVVQNLIMDTVGLGVLVEPYIISDFYYASQAAGSPHQEALQSARRIHQELDDMTISGKDADEYSLGEMAEFGKQRHQILFKTLENKYKTGAFDLTLQELNSVFQ